jgi:hypothetical protein
MPRPVNTFDDYPVINEAYAKARKVVIAIIEDFNESHTDGLGYWAKDLPVMDYVQSCIPRHLNPPVFGRNTCKVQDRIRDILYPHLKRGEFSPEQFAAWLDEDGRATRFTNQWMREREPSHKRGKHPQIELASLMDAGFLVKGAVIYFSCEGNNYQGELTASGKFRCDMGNGVELFRSPHDAVRQTLSRVFNQWRACTTEDSDGNIFTLDELRERFRRLKGL